MAEHAKAERQASSDAAIERIRKCFQPFCDIKPNVECPYLIEGLIPRVGLVVVWGPPKEGKSYWVFNLMLHIALGHKYRGRYVEQGAVVYCAFEGHDSMRKRIEAFRRRFLPENPNIPFHLGALSLDLTRDHKTFIAGLRAYLGIGIPSVVVLDTLNKSLFGSENKDEDMSAYIRAADTIREEFQCAVIVVHHCGTNGSRPRGHTALTGALDMQIKVGLDKDDCIIARVELAKDDAQGSVDMSYLEVVEIGKDKFGKPVKACVVLPAEGVSGQSAVALKALNTALREKGETIVQEGDMPTRTHVPVDCWRDQFFADMRTTGTWKDVPKNTQNKSFKRCIEKLQETGMVGISGKLCWIV